MSVEIVRGTNQKPASSRDLADLISRKTRMSGRLFIGYPTIGTSQGPYPIDALLVSADKGIVVFDLIEGIDTNEYELRQDDSANKLEARLKLHRELMFRRNLRIPIHTISFAPAVGTPLLCVEDDYPLVNSESLIQELEKCQWNDENKEVTYSIALSAIENIRTIRQSSTNRIIKIENSRGAKLKCLEDSIATMDHKQSKAFIETVEGVQRIRGLAGAGKTIVLARKAAYLHAQHPEWRLAVTFHTRSLKDFYRQLIYRFSLGEQGQEPNWERLRIVHAWGASGGGESDGIYYEFCRENDAEYLNFGMAERRFSREDAFAGSCTYALSQVHDRKQVYDAILVDEAQDLPESFMRLCYEFLKDPKRLVYAYDELQKLSGESLAPPEKIFGRTEIGRPRVRFDGAGDEGPQRDIMLT